MRQVASLLGILVLAPVAAHGAPTLGAGARVRVTTVAADSVTGAGQRFEGVYLSSRGGTIRLLPATGDTLSLPLADARSLEVARGGSAAGPGAGIGFASGFAIGAIVGSAAFRSQKDDFFSIGSEGQWMLACGAGLGLIGGLVGAVVGANHKTTRWRPVSLESLSLDLEASGARATLALSSRF